MDEQVLQLFQPCRWIFNCVSPSGVRANIGARSGSRSVPSSALTLGCDHLIDGHEQTPRLRRKLVERTAQHLVRETVGDGYVGDVTSMYSTGRLCDRPSCVDADADATERLCG